MRLLGQRQRTSLLMTKHENINIFAPVSFPSSPMGQDDMVQIDAMYAGVCMGR